ncbi:unnamed protein product [Bemisia tabaci]|uniref:FAD dependent oxidoreductase domain-containing protein n=1 Tax=Bemisia tabaci TaxID=7038 RepID=A0A9N9ZZB7_BEMTA|nr:unnamed protein product [Bemisia tabaci]
MSDLRIGIIGAGIVGLNTALEVRRVLPDADVTILAELFNDETTSDGAAGLVEISTSFRGPSLDITRQWVKDSHDFYNSLKSNPDAGIAPITGFYLAQENPDLVKNPYLNGILPVFRPANQDELKDLGAYRFATYMSTLVVTCRMYLPWALGRLRDAGVFIKKTKVNSLYDIEDDYDIVFNCTGLGARRLCEDIGVVPIRGQVVKVRAPFVQKFFMNNENGSYIIPSMQSGLVTLGGTQDFGHWSQSTSEYNTHSIFDRCRDMMPTLESATVEWHWVGLRPYRHQVRTELEKIGNLLVVHNYGHGGYGIATSPGTAKYVVNMLQNLLKSHPSKSIKEIISQVPLNN